MATQPLAAAADLIRLGYPTDDATDGLIARASARIRRDTKQVITQVIDDVVTLRAANPLLLPQRPVTAVSQVEQLLWDNSAIVLPELSWQLRSNRIEGIGGREYWPYLGMPVWVRVTYTHGYAQVPDEIIDVLGEVVTRLANTPAEYSPVKGAEAIDDYRVTYNDNAPELAAGLLPGELAALNRIIGSARYGSVSL